MSSLSRVAWACAGACSLAACPIDVEVPLPEGADTTARFLLVELEAVPECGLIAAEVAPRGELPPVFGRTREAVLLELGDAAKDAMKNILKRNK